MKTYIYKNYTIAKRFMFFLYLVFLLSNPIFKLTAQNSQVYFTDVTEEAGINFRYTFGDYTYENILESSGSGITIFDYNNDGLPDLYMLNGTYVEGISDADGKVFKNTGNKLYKNNGNGTFTEVSREAGVDDRNWGMAAGAIDYDNDGDLDIFSANGTAEELILQPPLLLENDGKGHFKNTGPELCDYFSTKRSGRTMAVWDYDNDGDMDIIVSHIDLQATATLLRNDGANPNHWLGLKLTGENGPASAIGARITVTIGNKKRVYINQWSTSYLSNNDSRVHIGLGQHKHIDRIEIFWSDGRKETYNNPPVDCYLTIEQGTGIIVIVNSK